MRLFSSRLLSVFDSSRVWDCLAALSIALMFQCTESAEAGVIFYSNDPSGFATAMTPYTFLGTENFEEGSGGGTTLVSPLQQGVPNSGVFPSGITQPITISHPLQLYFSPAFSFGPTDVVITGGLNPGSPLKYEFNAADQIGGVGFNLVHSGGTALVSVFSSEGASLGSLPMSGDLSGSNFMGIRTDSGEFIGRVELSYLSGANNAGADNIQLFQSTPLNLNWVGGSSDQWSDASNWAPSFVPESISNVSITPPSFGANVTGPSDPASITSLTIGAQSSGIAQLNLTSDLTAANGVTVQNAGKISLANAVLDPGTELTIDGAGEVVGYGVIVGDIGGTTGASGVSASNGNLNLTGPLDLGTRDAMVLSLSFANLGSRTTFDGSTITVPKGLFLQGASSLEGNGTVAGRVAGAFGSTIIATGDLALGDSNSFTGFTSDGELYTNDHLITLYDKNQAVLPSLTQLGTSSAEGQLTAPNGMLLEEGKTLAGRGTVSGDFKNQGEVIGDADVAGERIVFASGYDVSGIGTFENTEFLGNFNPGNSPASLDVIDVTLGAGSLLNIELGGLTAGTEYDQLFSQGTLILGGSLGVSLINNFEPNLGQTFTIVDNDGTINGQFSGLSQGDLVSTFGEIGLFIDYAGGDGNDIVLFASSANNAAVPEPSSLMLLGFGALGLVRRARRRKQKA